MDEEVTGEIDLRLKRFRSLRTEVGFAEGVTASELNKKVEGLRVFYGGRGIWYDASRTALIDRPGVTVGLLHTGRHYSDDLLPDGIIYHYPSTESPGKDTAEIEATKNAGRLGVPLFVVVQRGSFRDVHLGIVEDFDDADETFLIRFVTGDDFHWEAPEEFGILVEDEFVAFEKKPRKRLEVMARERDPRFAFKVKKRSGSACAVCRLSLSALIDAAHVIPVKDGGSNHPANGLPLCATHHRAFDAGLFAIDPESLQVLTSGQHSRTELRISVESIDWLAATPNPQALAWHLKNVVQA